MRGLASAPPAAPPPVSGSGCLHLVDASIAASSLRIDAATSATVRSSTLPPSPIGAMVLRERAAWPGASFPYGQGAGGGATVRYRALGAQ